MTIDQILSERGKQYGEFSSQALLTQNLKSIMRRHGTYELLTPSQKEALEMIQHKAARIVNGNPNHIDSWDDIAGYATLVANELREQVNT